MDDDAFRPGTPEVQLQDLATVLMSGGPFSNKRGHALLTNDRVLFSDQKFDAAMSTIGPPKITIPPTSPSVRSSKTGMAVKMTLPGKVSRFQLFPTTVICRPRP